MAGAKKVEARVRKLKDKAFKLLTDEKYDKALDIYIELTDLNPENGEWPRRAADCHWHLKQPDQRLKFSLMAAKAYSDAGLMLKAIAMCKVVLSIDPNHRETQERLAKLHSVRPKAGEPKPQLGVKRHAVDPAAPGAARVRLPGRKRSRRPITKEGVERNAEKARTRMAAATALRKARAQKRKAEIATNRKRRGQDQIEAAPQKQPPSEDKVLGRVALKPVMRKSSDPSSAPVKGPPSSAFPDPSQPEIPSLRLDSQPSPDSAPPLRLDPTPKSNPAPALESFRLSDRVPAKAVESIPPELGSAYSLTLSDVPAAELRAARIPDIATPIEARESDERVPVIPHDSSGIPTPRDSLVPDHVGLYDDRREDRASFAQKSFATIPLLSGLDPDVLRQLITDVAMVELETNEILFHEGDAADAMYVVVEGSMTAVTLPHGERPIELAHLGEGEFFGEIGLMGDQPRGATLSAHEPSRLLRFDREIVGVLVEQDPTFLATLLQFLKDRLVEDLMMSSPLFLPFTEEERYDLADQFEFLEIEPNSVLLEQGQNAIGMYVLLTGEAQMKGASDAGTVRKLGPGDIFGEQSLLNGEPSSVEVKTTSKSFALCLACDAFPEVIMTHPTVLDYLSSLKEGAKGELDVAEDFLDHVRFF